MLIQFSTLLPYYWSIYLVVNCIKKLKRDNILVKTKIYKNLKLVKTLNQSQPNQFQKIKIKIKFKPKSLRPKAGSTIGNRRQRLGNAQVVNFWVFMKCQNQREGSQRTITKFVWQLGRYINGPRLSKVAKTHNSNSFRLA